MRYSNFRRFGSATSIPPRLEGSYWNIDLEKLNALPDKLKEAVVWREEKVAQKFRETITASPDKYDKEVVEAVKKYDQMRAEFGGHHSKEKAERRRLDTMPPGGGLVQKGPIRVTRWWVEPHGKRERPPENPRWPVTPRPRADRSPLPLRGAALVHRVKNYHRFGAIGQRLQKLRPHAASPGRTDRKKAAANEKHFWTSSLTVCSANRTCATAPSMIMVVILPLQCCYVLGGMLPAFDARLAAHAAE
jgi:hypothetical protein